MYSAGIAKFYDFFTSVPTDAQEECAFVTSIAPPAASLLDIGAGVGNVGFELASAGFDVTLLEPDPEMFAVLLTRLALRGDLMAKLSPINRAAGFATSRTFDVVTCFSVLHLQTKSQQLATLQYVASQLGRGGKFVFSLPLTSPSRATKPRAMVAERQFGSVRFEHWSSLLQLADERWQTTWEFTTICGAEVLEKTVQQFAWRTCSAAYVETLLAAAGLRSTHRFADFKRSPVVKSMSGLLVGVAQLP